MSYRSIVEMAGSMSLRDRIAAASAQEGVAGDPVVFAQQHMWALAAQSEWVAAWDYAVGQESRNVNPDTGARDDVISDAMILSAVQPLVSAT